MAPEQVTGKAGTVGPPADVYALGATLYEMLTGRPPFRAKTAAETERQLLSREPVPPSQLNAKVPRLQVGAQAGTPVTWSAKRGEERKPGGRCRAWMVCVEA